MPEIRASAYVPQPVNQELQLPIAFPPLPRVMVERFGAEAKEYEDSLQQFWTRTRRVLADLRFDVTAPVNKVVKDTKSVVEHMEEFDEGFIKITDAVRLGAAAIVIEKELRENADGNLSGMYTLRVTAGSVVTGMIITSTEDPDPANEISEIIFQTNVLKVQTATGPVITLLKVATTGIVFGADVSSDNFVSGLGGTGWRLGRNTGILECNNGLFRGAIYAEAGLIGGFTIAGNHLQSVSLGPYAGNFVVMDPDPNIGFVVGGWNGTAPTGAYAQLSVPAGLYPELELWDNTGLHSHVGPGGVQISSATESLIISRTTLLWGVGSSYDTNLRRYSGVCWERLALFRPNPSTPSPRSATRKTCARSAVRSIWLSSCRPFASTGKTGARPMTSG